MSITESDGVPRIASPLVFELSFRLRPPLDSFEHVLSKNTALDSCLSRPGNSVGKVSRSTATKLLHKAIWVECVAVPWKCPRVALEGSQAPIRERPDGCV